MKYLPAVLFLLSVSLSAQEETDLFSSKTFKGLEFRNIGPAFASGRIADIAIHPSDENTWYVAVGSGGVWKTSNSGVTWTPVFDDQSSYSIGCVTIDPVNPHTIWVGTGENVGGRHVGFGDGVYRSNDGGKTWKNLGLKQSEHISRIVVHPENPDIVFVAVQGPLWSSGGDRGLYKSTDGGMTWNRVLGDGEWTGVTEVVIDPEDPDRLYAATWQRHRNVAAYLGGGPGSGIHRSRDGGETWEKLEGGLPTGNLGKIGLAISPFDTDVIYAAIELDRRTGGLYISRDRGSSWTKQSEAVSGATGPHYYQELYASPHREGTIYLVDVYIQVSDDHGKSFSRMNQGDKHSDDHAIAFRMSDPDYLLVGSDGGIYESFDAARTWRFIANLPVTQYYKLAVDDSEPFYFIYGGTQDNGSHGGPSRTDSEHGIRNADWFRILGADGHQTATEPGNPGIVYAETQEGGLHRIDRNTGEQVYIQPQAGEGEPHERFNWDTPILVSPHNPARIYTASYRVWRSDDRGDSWESISPDLTRNLDRFRLPMMGRVQSWDNAWDLYAMSTYSTITSLAESPLQEGLIYAGTDDGLIQVTGDGGKNWRKVEAGSVRGIPAGAFVNDIRADLFDARTVYAALDNHKAGDFKPYLLVSRDAGKTWNSIAGNLPDRSHVWRLVQDHQRKELLFAATESGIWFTLDNGIRWTRLTGGVPTISFRDITIQRRENDLVGASFGRGFFILDDITPLRMVSPELLGRESVLFPVRDAWWYLPRNVVTSQGSADYSADNPPFGAVFTYYLGQEVKTLKQKRKELEKTLDPESRDIPFPGWDSLEKEIREKDPYMLFTIKDGQGNVVNQVTGPAGKGFHRVSWNLRHASGRNIGPDIQTGNTPVASSGFLATPGTYTVTMALVAGGEVRSMPGEEKFGVKPLRQGVIERVPDGEFDGYRRQVEAFQAELGKVQAELEKAGKTVNAMVTACLRLDREAPGLLDRVYLAESGLKDVEEMINGKQAMDEVGEKQPATPRNRLAVASRGLSTTYGPTGLHRASLEMGLKELEPIRRGLEEYTLKIIPALEEELKKAGVVWYK